MQVRLALRKRTSKSVPRGTHLILSPVRLSVRLGVAGDASFRALTIPAHPFVMSGQDCDSEACRTLALCCHLAMIGGRAVLLTCGALPYGRLIGLYAQLPQSSCAALKGV